MDEIEEKELEVKTLCKASAEASQRSYEESFNTSSNENVSAWLQNTAK
jgi:hypothetical protein